LPKRRRRSGEKGEGGKEHESRQRKLNEAWYIVTLKKRQGKDENLRRIRREG